MPGQYAQTQGVLLSPKLHGFGYEHRLRKQTGQKKHIPKRLRVLPKAKLFIAGYI